MQTINPNKRIYLSGGGNEHQSFPLDKFFFETLKRGGMFLYVPVALRGHRLYPTANLWMNGILELHERTDLAFEIADEPSAYAVEDMKKFDAIYIGGGNTWSLLKELKDSGFSEGLLSYIEDGMPVYGGSAGAIVLGKRIDTHDDENKIHSTDIQGFSELGNYSVTCHFDPEGGDRFSEWAKTNSLPILCLPEETGLVVDGNVVTCVGDKACSIYDEQGTLTEILPGNTFKI